MRITDEMLRRNAAQARELWLDSLPQKNELPEYTLSPRFQEKMDRLLRKGRRVEKRKAFCRACGRVAAVLLLFSIVSFTGLMTADAAFRERVLQVVSQVFPRYTQYQYRGNQEDAKLPELQLDALPEGFQVLSDEQFMQESRYIQCRNDIGNYLDIDVDVASPNKAISYQLDTEDAQLTEMDIQGRAVTVISKKDWHILLWTEESVIFTVFSDLALPKLILFVEGITKMP